MSHFRRLLFIALFISILPFAHADQAWVEVRSPHFNVITDAGDKRGREIAMRFEQMRTAFGMIFSKVNVSAAPLEIVAFRDTRGLRHFAPLYDGKPIAISGLFLADGRGEKNNPEDRQFITFDISAEDNWTLVSHEYAHMLVNSNFPPTPPWFDEGFAEYCSSLRVGKKEIDLGLVPPDPPIVLSGHPWLKLVDLFSVTRDSKIYNRDDRRSVFYAQSWLTVHYIMANRLIHEMAVYNRLVQHHVPVPDAIRQAFHMEPAQLERTISNYYNSGQITYFKTAALPAGNEITFNTRVLNDLELKTVMADLDFHSRDYGSRGIAEFKEILAVQPDNPVANRSLGYAALDDDDWEKTGEYFKRASAKGSKDPQLHYLLALQMSQEKAEGKSAVNESIVKELQTALALKPNYAEAYELLGTTLAFNMGQMEKGIESLKTALRLNPHADWYVANLARAYVRAQMPDDALPLFRRLQNSSVPHVAAMAGKEIIQLERYNSESSGGQSQF